MTAARAGDALDVEEWLATLLVAEEESGDGIVLDGWVLTSELTGEIEKVRLVVGGLYLSFAREDVTDIESVVAAGHGSVPPGAFASRVVVRRGAPILDIRLERLCLQQTRRPFALSVRPSTITLGPSNRFRELERQFLRDHSLVDP